MKQRTLSIILALVMLFGTISIVNVSAETDSTIPESYVSDDSDINIKATNSFGEMLSSAIDSKMDEQEKNNGCNIFSVEISDGQADVTFETLKNCTLVVGIYTEDGTQLITSSGIEVKKEDKTATVDMNNLPTYYYIRAYLVDTETYQPLCTEYSSPNYTQEMQEFLSKTTDDFDSNRVLNLDDDETNNFAVFGDDVKIIPESTKNNKVTKADDSTNTYIIENADSSITSLNAGDTFSYEYNNETLIVKIASISVNGTTVTIKGEDTEMSEVFDFVKIDTNSSLKDAEYDPSTCDEGVTYEGMFVESKYNSDGSSVNDIDKSQSFSLSYKIDKELTGVESDSGNASINVKLSGSLNFKVDVSLKVYVTLFNQYFEIGANYSAGVTLSISGSAKASLPIGHIGFMPVAGVIIEFTPSFIVDFNAKISLSGTLFGNVGFSASNTDGVMNKSTVPVLKAELKTEISLYLGFSLEPKIKIIHDNIANAKLTAKVGAQIIAKQAEYIQTSGRDEIHDCVNCIDGDINGKFDLTFSVELLNNEKLSFTCNILDKTVKILDFYYSEDHHSFGFTTCPYIKYKVSGKITEGLIDAAPNATITVNGTTTTTDANGKYTLYLPKGDYTLEVSKDGYFSSSKKFSVEDKAITLDVRITKNTGSGSDGDDSGNSGDSDSDISNLISNAQTVSLGDSHSACITNAGSLYTWGFNDNGQLGDGTTTNRSTPKKIMENVVGVSLGYSHSACITKDGSLYTWGRNYNGRLGDGTTHTRSSRPKKIMDNVVQVSLGGSHSACITNDGSLYTCGYNGDGRLGDGTYTNSSTPKKIMDNVVGVSLGDSYSACITKDGSLYTWGDNGYGQLGDGTKISSSTPQKIMDNVTQVSLGYDRSACITTDGSLYTWGRNSYGQLGDGTTTDCYTPKKIMDNVVGVSLGRWHGACITKYGSLYTWGSNGYGRLGDGTKTNSSTPKKIMDNVVGVSLGGYHSACITKYGSLYTWGENDCGQLGTGTSDKDAHSTPEKIMDNIMLPTVLTSVNSQSYLSSSDNSKSKSFTELNPNTLYNFYSMKSKEAENLFDADNLLYIVQARSDDNGNLTIEYTPKEVYTDAEEFVAEFEEVAEYIDDPTVDPPEPTTEPTTTKPTSTEPVTTEPVSIEPTTTPTTTEPTTTITIAPPSTSAQTTTSAPTTIAAPTTAVTTTTVVPTTTESVTILYGDLNSDGKINLLDLIAMRKYLAKWSITVDKAAADCNADGKINLLDLILMRKYLAKWSVVLGPQK